jgi:hypothetical protein
MRQHDRLFVKKPHLECHYLNDGLVPDGRRRRATLRGRPGSEYPEFASNARWRPTAIACLRLSSSTGMPAIGSALAD